MQDESFIFIGEDQLEIFKSHSHRLFRLLHSKYDLPMTPLQKSLDILAKSFGYTSHSALTVKARGIGPKTRPLLEQVRFHRTSIAKKLEDLVAGLDQDTALHALLLIFPAEKKVPKFIGALKESPFSTDAYRSRSVLHELYIEGKITEIVSFVESGAISKAELTKDSAWLFPVALKNGQVEFIHTLSDLGFLESKDILNNLLVDSIRLADAESAMYFLEKGAELNGSPEDSIFDNILQLLLWQSISWADASRVIDFAISTNRLLPDPRNLKWACFYNATPSVIALIDSISTESDREEALRTAIKHAQSYPIAYLLSEYPDLQVDITHTLQGMKVHDMSYVYGAVGSLLAFQPISKRISASDVLAPVLFAFDKGAKDDSDEAKKILQFDFNGEKLKDLLTIETMCSHARGDKRNLFNGTLRFLYRFEQDALRRFARNELSQKELPDYYVKKIEDRLAAEVLDGEDLLIDCQLNDIQSQDDCKQSLETLMFGKSESDVVPFDLSFNEDKDLIQPS